MNKETLITNMTEAVAELLNKRDAIEEFVDSIDTAQAQHSQAILELEEQLQAHEEALAMAQDLGEAKLIRAQIKESQEDIELVKSVNKAQVGKMYEQVSELAVETFSAHKDAVAQFKALDDFMVLNTTLAELQANKKMMADFALTLSITFKGVRAILLDTGIVANADQNRNFRGTHLGMRDQVTELYEFDVQTRKYVSQLRSYGFKF